MSTAQKDNDSSEQLRLKQILETFRQESRWFAIATVRLEESIRGLIDRAGIRTSMVDARLKKESSLERKLNRKRKYQKLTEVTDLIGVRVITYDSDDADRISKVLRDGFLCDWDNCEDKSDRLRAEQFGYRSDHLVVFIPGEPPSILAGIRAEIQVRTLLQHAWAEIEHDDLGYHSEALVPAEIRRRLARVAAVLEGVDNEFREIRKIARRSPLRSIRGEGITEPLGEVEFSLNPMTLRAIQGSDLTLYFNTNVTPTPGLEKEPLLIIEDSAVSKPVRGELIGANAIRFANAVPQYMNDQLRHVRCRLRGIRVNANQLGISATMIPTEIVCAVGVSRIENGKPTQEFLNQQSVAEVQPGLSASCALVSRETNTDYNVVELRFVEGFPGAFKNSLEETAGDRISKPGTRFMARFAGLPPDLELWISCKNIIRPDLRRPSASASLVETDVNGGGATLPRKHEGTKIACSLEGSCDVLLAQGSGSARWAVWEMDSSSVPTSCIRTVSFRAFIKKEFWPSEGLTCSLSLAPLTIVTTAANHSVPRFADVATSRRIGV